jgi:hypothetical protein
MGAVGRTGDGPRAGAASAKCARLPARPADWSAAVVVALAFAVVLAACGGGGSDPRVIDAGQVDIKLPQGYKVVAGKIVTPPTSAVPGTAASTGSKASDATGSAPPGAVPQTGATATTGSTIPLDNKTDPTTDLFAAFGKFRKCLDDLGVKFIGAPDASNPNSPSNDPTYLKNLSTCAARSNIVQTLSAATAAENNLTPAEIEQRNKGYLKWRSCMVDRGWKIPVPTPDAQGRLFSIGASGASNGANAIQPPAGKDILTSNDVQQCAAKVQKATAKP